MVRFDQSIMSGDGVVTVCRRYEDAQEAIHRESISGWEYLEQQKIKAQCELSLAGRIVAGVVEGAVRGLFYAFFAVRRDISGGEQTDSGAKWTVYRNACLKSMRESMDTAFLACLAFGDSSEDVEKARQTLSALLDLKTAKNPLDVRDPISGAWWHIVPATFFGTPFGTDGWAYKTSVKDPTIAKGVDVACHVGRAIAEGAERAIDAAVDAVPAPVLNAVAACAQALGLS